MKTTLLFAFLILCEITIAQTWVQQTSGTDSILQDVHFINPNTGFVCGARGIVLETTNGGTNWNPLTTGITDGLMVIRFLNSDTGFVDAAHDGTLLNTHDGGSTWNNIGPNMPGKQNGGMWFKNADTGFLAIGSGSYSDSKILKTHNGGISWDTVYSGANWISYITFSDANHGWATASGSTVLKTTDGGNNWTVKNVGGNYWMSAVSFFDPNNGLVGGGYWVPGSNPAIWKTADGGSNWTPVFSQTNSNCSFMGVSKMVFPDSNNGFAINVCTNTVGIDPGTLLKTADGGSNWTNEPTPKGNLRGLFFTSASNGYAVGDSGVILKYGIGASVKEVESGFNISVYPNPATDQLNINTGIGSVLEIFTVQGYMIKSMILTDTVNTIDVKELISGIYIVRIMADHETVVKKFIKH